MDTQMVRTTMYLPVETLELVKRRAFEDKISMSRLFDEMAKEKLGVKKKKKKKYRIGSYDLKPKFEKFERWMAYE